MSALTTVLLAADAGDIALIGASYFRVTEVREPTHSAAPGLVWHGYWWLDDRGHWGAPAVLHLHEGKPVPQLLTPAERAACGWGELP
jgi:hypothetical protein